MSKVLNFKTNPHFTKLNNDEQEILAQLQEEDMQMNQLGGFPKEIFDNYLESLVGRELIKIDAVPHSPDLVRLTRDGWEALHEQSLPNLDAAALKSCLSGEKIEMPIEGFTKIQLQRHYASMVGRKLVKDPDVIRDDGRTRVRSVHKITVDGLELKR